MAKYSKKITERISDLIEDGLTITEVCNIVRISRKTFYQWKSEIPDFAQSIEDTEERSYIQLAALARRTLREQIEGYTVEEATFTYQPAPHDEKVLILKKKVVKQKRKEPSIASLNMLINSRLKKKQQEEKTQPEQKKMEVMPRNEWEQKAYDNFLKRVKKEGRFSEKPA